MGIFVGIIVLTAIAVVLMLLSITRDHYLSGFFKLIASTGFILLGISSGGIHSPYGWAVLAGLCFSWWGDMFLISKSRGIFMFGLIAFFVAHLAYITAFILYGTNLHASLYAFGILLIPGAFLVHWLYPYLGKMRLPVLSYMLVITVMVALAAGVSYKTGHIIMVAAALIFYCSDIFVARDRFVSDNKVNGYMGLPLYYLAQILFAVSTVYAC